MLLLLFALWFSPLVWAGAYMRKNDTNGNYAVPAESVAAVESVAVAVSIIIDSQPVPSVFVPEYQLDSAAKGDDDASVAAPVAFTRGHHMMAPGGANAPSPTSPPVLPGFLAGFYTATPPSCVSTVLPDALGNTWKAIYNGSGFTEDINNPSNVGLPIQTLNFAKGLVYVLEQNSCLFIQECLAWAYQWNNLWSVDLHLLATPGDNTGMGYWSCVGFQAAVGGVLGGLNYYTIAPASGTEVVQAYAYDLVGGKTTPCPAMAQSANNLNCGASWSSGGSDSWTQQYFGSCFTATIPGANAIYTGPVASNTDNLNTACNFLTACMAYAISFHANTVYQNVAAYLVMVPGQSGRSQWQCTAYYSLAAPSPTTNHNVPNSTVLISYVYYRPQTQALGAPTCNFLIPDTVNTNMNWYQLYDGAGYVERPSDPNTIRTGQVVLQTWPGAPAEANLALACTYLNACFVLANATTPKNVDFHLIADTASSSHWVCLGYTGNALQNAFTVQTGNAIASYGYDLINPCAPSNDTGTIYNDGLGWRWNLTQTARVGRRLKVTGSPATSPSGPKPLLIADTCAELTRQLAGLAYYHLSWQHADISLVSDSSTNAHWETFGQLSTNINQSTDIVAAPTVMINYNLDKVPGLAYSLNGNCAGTIGCQGSTYGNCCSSLGKCGATGVYCGTGCQPALGDCFPAANLNGPCGAGNNTRCVGGQCCGSNNMCGTGAEFCYGGCKPQFGTCSILLVTFYTDQNYGGSAYPEYGTVGTCYDLESGISANTNSMTFQSGKSCTLYKGAGCTGASEVHVPSTAINNAFVDFADATVSFQCTS